MPDVGELGQQGGDAPHQAAHQETGTEYAKEVQDCLRMKQFFHVFTFSQDCTHSP